MITKSFPIFCALLLTATVWSQPTTVEWLKKNNTAKSIHTLQLLEAGPEGFLLLREKVESGKNNIPWWTQLNAEGGETYDQALPGFENMPKMAFQFAVKGNGQILVFADRQTDDNQYQSVTRTFSFANKNWPEPETPFFTPLTPAQHTNSTTGFRMSPDGQNTCIFRIVREKEGQTLFAAVFDSNLKMRWKTTLPVPKQEGITDVQQVFCSNAGQVFVHARQYSAGAQMAFVRQENIHPLYWPDGQPIFRNEPVSSGQAAVFSNQVMVIKEGAKKPDTYFIETITKYTTSFEMGEDPQHHIICAGMGGDESPDKADQYFIYSIDPVAIKGGIVKKGALPAVFRKAFMNESAAEQKKPVEDVFIRRVKFTPDGKAWLLAETETVNEGTGQLGPAALVKLDSTFRISGAIPIEKYNKVKAGERRCFSTVATCLSDKGNWWMLWQQGNWADIHLMLTPAKGKEDFDLTDAAHAGVAMLMNTVTANGSEWYWVGESEDGRLYRIGKMVKKTKK
jgi:hypothetical protein